MSLDFNTHSRLNPGLPGQVKPSTISEALNAHIDLALEQERAKRPPRDYIGMSELGDECLRRVYYSAIRAPRKPFSGAKLRIFEAGHLYESMAARWLKLAGFELLTHGSDGKQLRIADGEIGGGIDGVLVAGPPLPGLVYPALWENKGLAHKYWIATVKHKVRIEHPLYFGQAQLYMGYFELSNCLWTAENKNTCEIYAEVIKFELAEAQRYSDRGVEVIKAIKSGEPPRRLCPNSSFFETRMCDFADHCWSAS